METAAFGQTSQYESQADGLRRFRGAIRALGIGLLLACLAMIVMALIPAGSKPHHLYVGREMHDFIPYYAASRLVLAGHGDQMYNFASLHQVELALGQPLGTNNGVLPYLYPPYYALALTPLAALPFGAAAWLWLLMTCLLLSCVTLALQRYARLGGGGSLLLWLSVWCSIPVFITLRVGQVTILVLGLLTLSFFAMQAGHPHVAGMALACAMLKPPLVLPLLIVLLLHRRWAALAAFATSALILVAVPTILLGPRVDSAYLAVLHEAGTWTTQFGYAPQGNESFEGFTRMMLPQPAAMVVQVVLSVATLALLVVSVRNVPFDASLGLAIAVGLLICPHVGMYDLCLLLFPVAVMLRYRETIPAYPRLLVVSGTVVIPGGFALTSIAPLQLSVLMVSLMALRLSSYRKTSLTEPEMRPVFAMTTKVNQLDARRAGPCRGVRLTTLAGRS